MQSVKTYMERRFADTFYSMFLKVDAGIRIN